MSSMALIDWKPSYSVNIVAFDTQHKHLFDIINSLHEAMKNGRGNTVLRTTLHRLVEYTQDHFQSEEDAMRAFSFPGLAQHKFEHQVFIESVSNFKREFDSGHSLITPDILNFLCKWLDQHITGTDKGYSEFLNQNGMC